MDPVCAKCGVKVDSKREINVEVIDGGIGDKNYKVAIVYCSKCSHIHGVIPSIDMIKDIVKDAVKDAMKK